MNIRTLLLPVLFLAAFSLQINLSAQDILSQTTQDEALQATTDSLVLTAFPLTEITQQFTESSRQISDALSKHLTREAMSGYTDQVSTIFSEVQAFLGDSSTMYLENVSSRELDVIFQRAQVYMDQIKGLQGQFAKVAEDLENESVLLQQNKQRWQLTMEEGNETEAVISREERIQRTIDEIDSVSMLLQNDLVFILDQQDKLSDRNSALDEVVTRVRDQMLELGETILTRDAPGFFKELADLGDAELYHSHVSEFRGSVKSDLELMKEGYLRSVVLALLMLVGLLFFTFWFKENHKQQIAEEDFPLSKLHLVFINSPVASSLFIITLLVRVLVPYLPRTFYSINMTIMLIPMVILLIRFYGVAFRTWIIVLAIVVSFNLLYELTYYPGVLLRILLLALSFSGIWLFTWVYRKRPFAGMGHIKFIYKSFRVLIVGFAVMQFLAVIANLVGAFRLAEFLTLIPLQITILAIAIQLTTKTTATILYLILASNYLQKLNVIREEFQVIYKKCLWLAEFILLLLFISIALRILMVRDLVFAWGRGVLSDGIQIGAITISLGSILVFFFVIWLSIMITRIITNVLAKDVFTRVKTAKGIPGTVILLLKIALISGGFFLAAAASGMELTNLSIVLGAFSVGIGFGLQNIFNNMVSGLILAFERPINVGDVVQVGELMGTVRSIGLRSSKVLSFDGAEVIVPNGNLISNEMINWTLSDSNRRMDLRVGVAYGTDPEKVLAIMEQIAMEHKDVRKKPVPKGYFLEFGDSSLNFRLLAWVNLDNRLEVESEINVQINKKLAEAGIEIPFPQRDLHIRSDATLPKPANPGAKK